MIKLPSIRRLNWLDLLSGDGESGRLQSVCEPSDSISGWSPQFATAQLAGSRGGERFRVSHGQALDDIRCGEFSTE